MNHFDPHAHIDYISLTMPYPRGFDEMEEWQYIDKALLCLKEWTGNDEFGFAVNHMMGWICPGLHGYERRVWWEDSGVAVQWGGNNATIHIVLTGGGCKILKDVLRSGFQSMNMRSLFDGERFHFTRIDIAVDVCTVETPELVATMVYPKKGTSTGLVTSATGQTVYFGSRSSERMLRIYRYNAPHPRSHLLRLEWELKANHAQQVADSIYGTNDGLEGIIHGLAKAFGVLYHPIWIFIGETPPTPLAYKKHKDGGNIMWLHKVCIPALRDALADGTLDLNELRKALGIKNPPTLQE